MSKYKDLKIDYDVAISDLDFYKRRYEEVQGLNEKLCKRNQKLEKHNEELHEHNEELEKNLSRVLSQVNQLVGINNVNADVIQFLAARKFGDDSTIEFAAIKTYRGWETLYLHGEELSPSGKDVTIWAENNEAVRVEVSGS